MRQLQSPYGYPKEQIQTRYPGEGIASSAEMQKGLSQYGYFQENYENPNGSIGSFSVSDPRQMHRQRLNSILERIREMSQKRLSGQHYYTDEADGMLGELEDAQGALNNSEYEFIRARPSVIDPSLSSVSPALGGMSLTPEQHAAYSQRRQQMEYDSRPFSYSPDKSWFENRLMGMYDPNEKVNDPRMRSVTDKSLRSLGYNTVGQVEEMINALRRMNRVGPMGANAPLPDDA